MSGSNLSDPTANAAPPDQPTEPRPPARDAAAHPLGLTVYDLPSPAAVADADAARTRAGRLKMLLLFLVCLAPVVASYFTYYVVRPEGRRVFGELIDPQRPLPTVTAHKLDGTPQALPALKGQWLLVSVASGACDSACQQHLYLQRQLRQSLGKDKERVDWVWLVSDDAPIDAKLQPALAQATVLRVPPATLLAWLQPAAGAALRDHLYVVDPMGNWMMRFPKGLDVAGAAKAKRDLERLLRASASWDEAGRPSTAVSTAAPAAAAPTAAVPK